MCIKFIYVIVLRLIPITYTLTLQSIRTARPIVSYNKAVGTFLFRQKLKKGRVSIIHSAQ